MPTESTVIATVIERPGAVAVSGGGAGGLPPLGGDGDGDFGSGRRPDLVLRTYRTGMWLALGGITMIFAALTSSYIVRRGTSNDWQPTEIPNLLWFNTAVLAASSLTLERARRRLSTGWWRLTVALGLGFLAGQIAAWKQLAAAGVFLASNPSSSFFYVLTGLHGLHLLGGLLALSYVAVRGRGGLGECRAAAEVSALYWHFMDGLWAYLFLVLLWWR